MAEDTWRDESREEVEVFLALASRDEGHGEGWTSADGPEGITWHWLCSHEGACTCREREEAPACGARGPFDEYGVPTRELPPDARICVACGRLAREVAGGWVPPRVVSRPRQSLAEAWPQARVEVAGDPDGRRSAGIPVLPEARIDWRLPAPGRFDLAVYDDHTDHLVAWCGNEGRLPSGTVWLTGLPARIYLHPLVDGPWSAVIHNGERAPEPDEDDEPPAPVPLVH